MYLNLIKSTLEGWKVGSNKLRKKNSKCVVYTIWPHLSHVRSVNLRTFFLKSLLEKKTQTKTIHPMCPISSPSGLLIFVAICFSVYYSHSSSVWFIQWQWLSRHSICEWVCERVGTFWFEGQLKVRVKLSCSLRQWRHYFHSHVGLTWRYICLICLATRIKIHKYMKNNTAH